MRKVFGRDKHLLLFLMRDRCRLGRKTK